MTIGRRDVLKGIGGLAMSAALAPSARDAHASLAALDRLSRATDLPRKQDFDVSDGYTYLNAAYTHPIPRPAAATWINAASCACRAPVPVAATAWDRAPRRSSPS
jgi:hypothetical protein